MKKYNTCCSDLKSVLFFEIIFVSYSINVVFKNRYIIANIILDIKNKERKSNYFCKELNFYHNPGYFDVSQKNLKGR